MNAFDVLGDPVRRRILELLADGVPRIFRAGLVVAAALLVDYVMTVAVSVAAGVDNIISALPDLNPYRVAINIGFIVVLTAVNLRGMRESGRAFAVPTYAFIGGVMLMIGIGLFRTLLGAAPVA